MKTQSALLIALAVFLVSGVTTACAEDMTAEIPVILITLNSIALTGHSSATTRALSETMRA